MPTSDDLEFKKIVLERNLVPAAKIEECIQDLENYEKAGIPKPLAGILLDKELIGQDQVSGIYKLLNKGDAHFVRGYTILESLGQGGLGVVYKARRDNTGMIVALKIMYPNFVSNKEFVRRFMKEAKFSCQISHNHVVKGIDFGESNDIFYFAMEYVDGITLKDYIRQNETINESKAVEIILQAAKALRCIEEHNLIHRDIKPDNIMLTKDDFCVKVCDLGLAKCIEDSVELTVPGVVMGTPHYMSPEQGMAGGTIDIRSDIYSLGITLFHIVSGEVPYQGNTAVSILNQHVSADIPSPKDIRADVSENMCSIITKMMAKKQENRYQCSQDLIVDLERFIRAEPPLLVSQPIVIQTSEESNGENRDITQQRTIAMSSVIKGPSPEVEKVEEKSDGHFVEKPVTDNAKDKKSSVEHWEKITSKKSSKGKILFTLLFVAISVGCFYAFADEIRNYLEQNILKNQEIPDEIVAEIEIPKEEVSLAQKRKLQYEKELLAITSSNINITSDMVKVEAGKYIDSNNQKIQVEEFWIDAKEVSNKNYATFCKETNHKFPENWDSKNPNNPVTNITWYDANLYAKWAGKKLPSEEEWQYAARTLINNQAQNMIGSVWEWTNSFLGNDNKDRIIKGGNFFHAIGQANFVYKDGFYPYSHRKDIGFRCAYSP